MIKGKNNFIENKIIIYKDHNGKSNNKNNQTDKMPV